MSGWSHKNPINPFIARRTPCHDLQLKVGDDHKKVNFKTL